MTKCRVCGAELESQESQERGCCDVPGMSSVEEQVGFWLAHDPDQVCVNCKRVGCERRVVHD